jgi:hypothetical protein
MYCVIKCVKTKCTLKGKFASSVFHSCNAKTQICVTGLQCVRYRQADTITNTRTSECAVVLDGYNHLNLYMLLLLLLLLSNGTSWIYSISLLASQYSFGNSLEVWSSFGHTRR